MISRIFHHQILKELIEAKLERKKPIVTLRNGKMNKFLLKRALKLFIKFKKSNLRIPKKTDDTKYTAEELKEIPLDKVKQWIIAQDETAFAEKRKQ